jgi:flagellin
LKGDVDGNTKSVKLNGHDAGIKGKFAETTTAGTYKLTVSDLAAGNTLNIGGVEYSIKADSNINNKELSVADAKKMIIEELTKANNVGITGAGVATAGSWNAAGTSYTAATFNNVTGKPTVTALSDTEFQVVVGSVTTEKALSFNLHVGADADMTNKIGVDIETMNSTYLGVKGLDVVGAANDNGITATYAIDAIADAVQKVSDQRSALGAIQNRLEHTIANVDNVVENTTAAESRIRDTDMAEEMVTYSKNNILAQAGQSMLAQANQSTQGVLSLLG